MDPEVRRLVDFTADLIAGAAEKIRSTNQTTTDSVVVFNTGCDRAYACYRYVAALSGGKMPKPSPNDAPVVITNHANIVGALGQFYRLDNIVESEMAPGSVRLVVMTARTLSFLHLTADRQRRVYAPVCRAVENNVLRMVAVAWRNDRPGGFIFHDVFKTRRRGDQFIADYLERVATMEQHDQSEEHAVAILTGLVTHGAMKGPATDDQLVFWTALVGWLEKHGHIVNDNFNGIDLHYGTEEELRFADKLTKAIITGKFP